jgi:hypothetical protein
LLSFSRFRFNILMIIYVFILLLFLISIRYFGRDRVILFFIISILLLVVRYRDKKVGTDYSEYINYYQSYSGSFLDNFAVNYVGSVISKNVTEGDASISRSFEPGWILLISISKKFDLTYQNFQAMLFLVQIILLFVCLRMINMSLLCGLFFWYVLFYYFSYFNIIRQSLSMSFGLLFYCSIYNRRFFLSITSFILALSFHFTSIIILFAIPIFMFPSIFKFRIVVIIVSVILGIFSFEIILKYLSDLNGYSTYGDVEKINGIDLSLRSIYIFLSYLLFLVVSHSPSDVKKVDFFNNIWLFSIALQIILINYSYGARLYEFFSVISVFSLIPIISGKKFVASHRMIYLLVLILSTVQFFWNIYFNTYGVSQGYGLI